MNPPLFLCRKRENTFSVRGSSKIAGLHGPVQTDRKAYRRKTPKNRDSRGQP